MSDCRFCRYTDGAHDVVACPDSMTGAKKALAVTSWHNGCSLGRSGAQLPVESSPTFILGFREGVRALEDEAFCEITDDHSNDLWDALMIDLKIAGEEDTILTDLSIFPVWVQPG